MSVREEKSWSLWCDWPGHEYQLETYEYSIFGEGWDLDELATDTEWRLGVDGSHYCPEHPTAWASDLDDGDEPPAGPYLLIDDDGRVTYINPQGDLMNVARECPSDWHGPWKDGQCVDCGKPREPLPIDILDVLADAEAAPTADRDEVAEVIDAADDAWQHGIGSGGYDISGPVLGIPTQALADALLAQFDIRRKA